MSKYRYLNIKGTVLDNYQIQNYMEKIASSHEINRNSLKSTYPIPRLKDNFIFIEKTYELLNSHAKLGIEIHPAGEWLLDNFYIIEETCKTILREMNLKKYKQFPGLVGGIYNGYCRIYVLASEIVAYTDNKIDDEILNIAITSYQNKKLLSMEEIWNLWIFLDIAIIENIRNICEKIYASQNQKYKVENIIERLVERKESKKQVFKNVNLNKNKKMSYKEMRYPFIEYMSYKLKKYGKQGVPYLNILEEQVNKMGMTISEVIRKEHYDIAILKVSLGNSITSLKEILRVNFLSLFEQINGVEEILKNDPSGIYSKMDYKTKEYYRNVIKEISEKTKISEIYISKKLIELSNLEFIKDKNYNNKKSHIGYYLISDGKEELFKSLGIKTKKQIAEKQKVCRYIIANIIVSICLSFLFGLYFYNMSRNILISIIFAIILIIPISEIVIQLINYILSKIIKPKLLPKLDFIKGVPKEYSTIVVIPTILKDKNQVKNLMKKLEVYYLANKSKNIYFTLLGDCTSSKNEIETYDEEIIKEGLKETEKLNKIYTNSESDIPKFSFLYRKRIWNPNEKCYMGWERKRGLLCEFNEFLVEGTNHFRANTLTRCVTSDIKYVITLDSDTNLCLETGLELIGTMAHILNKPEIDLEKKVVTKGHGIIQPRIGIDLESSRKTLFTKIFSGTRRNRLIYKCNFRYLSR